MMICLFYFFFMIPLFFIDYFIFHFMFLLIIFFFSLIYYTSFFCSLSYIFGLDGFSYWLILLSFFIICMMLISFNCKVFMNLGFYCFFVLVLSFLLFMIFSCINFFFFYLFFEFSLIPILVIILGWGYQPERLISGIYLFFYTLFASLPLLIFIIKFFFLFNSLFFDFFYFFNWGFFVHFSMIFAFLVKFPMFMVHFWLPKAHVQAPVFGSMVLASILLKIGGYGLIRFIFINELVFLNYSFFWYSFCIYGCILVSFICLIQGDIKMLIAYSSICHMSMCMLGILSMTSLGFFGSFLMMLGHGLCSSCLFFFCGVFYDIMLSRSFFINKGLVNFFPILGLFWFILCSFNLGCPPSINFISELMIMLGVISYFNFSFYFFILICFLSSCFSFYLFMYVYHGNFFMLYSSFSFTIREFSLIFFHLFLIFFFIFLLDFILI